MSLKYADEFRFVDWLRRRVVEDARGETASRLPIAPSGRFWLGRLAPQERVEKSLLGERGERMEPCETGVKFKPMNPNETLWCRVSLCAWVEDLADDADPHGWKKTELVSVEAELTLPSIPGQVTAAARQEMAEALAKVGAVGLSAEVRAELEVGERSTSIVVLTVVNTSPEKLDHIETNLYQVQLEVRPGKTFPFQLDALPDSFRYKRDVPAYGVNCGVEVVNGALRTADMVTAIRHRPAYWDSTSGPAPDLRFLTLAVDPIAPLTSMVEALERWGKAHWDTAVLRKRGEAEEWSLEMAAEAAAEGSRFWAEAARVRVGLKVLATDDRLQRAFMLANESFLRAKPKYDGWRPFQLGFLLACIPSIQTETALQEAAYVDTLWFATGGGKTETYLGLLVTAAFYDRLRGKAVGMTGWTRFPLRMLSLQQLQRFADIFGAAELVRRDENVRGATFSVGFLVGPATPNRLKKDPADHEPNWRDGHMPSRFQVLLNCPFCGSADLRMVFDPAVWSLQHRCTNELCEWNIRSLGSLPFYVVDEEIYRFLPTIVVGTLDKAANLSMQAAMRGFYAAPLGHCSAGHGFTYAPRSKRPNGCLYPDCDARPDTLPQTAALFPPTIRLQDELHLLRDSLGAVDSHYEGLYDHALAAGGAQGKVLASSATLQGYDRQVDVLYRRAGRLFPLPGPQARRSFWSIDSEAVMRTFAAVAPRGVTTEFAADRLNEAIQVALRDALDRPDEVAAIVGVPLECIPELVCLYGVGVVYGPTIRDVEAAARSFETQIPVEPLVSVRLTGSTPFEEVRETLGKLETDCAKPFGERIHLIAASSMLSHGVDVERLNVMAILGMPLTMAEFIQTTSRIGRSHPGLVFLIAKMARERDSAMYRSFEPLIEHAERLVDPVPVTRKSRRVLDVTFAGLFLGRLHAVHEPRALRAGLRELTTVPRVRTAFARLGITEEEEFSALSQILGLTADLDQHLRDDLRRLIRQTFRAINDPATTARFLGDIMPNGGPMLSLRDVETQVPVYTERLT